MGSKTQKWLKWEFWPFWFFYIPVYAKYLWLSLKAGSMAFFTASNPLMFLGGFTDYSKYGVLSQIDKNYLPVTLILERPNKESIRREMVNHKLSFPIILKPDKGERGFGVEKIDSETELERYCSKYKNVTNIILQEYADYPLELGIMYSRKASEVSGRITSVVMKRFLSITGDGKSTLEALLLKDPRAKFYLEDLLEIHDHELGIVLPEGKKKELVAIGNHCRGTTFLNANDLINNHLVEVFNKISIPINGFHFGRYDLRVPDTESLYAGTNIKIMELNGAASEPAHIYEPGTKLIKAYKDLFAHWQRLYEISRENKALGIPYNSAWEVYKSLRERGQFKKQNN